MLRRLLAVLLLGLAPLASSAFTLTDTQGKTHRLADYRGKWVLVNFWATWCPPCLEEMPDLQKLHETRKDLVVIGIAMDWRDPEYVKKFADDLFVTFPIVLGNPQIAGQIGQVQGLPTTYLYDPEGRLAAYNVGALTRAAVESYIARKSAPAKK
ncbi:TlpA family protein disulfide reductase [Thiobacter aerophilum]|uniref:TlpA disulfide reductase family protein n=1 Tax=Thiobacter aerophilum TaxID=3121275 RepID=A0ABV0EEH2_9BURK